MTVNGDQLGTDIKDAVERLSDEEKADLEIAWQAIAGEIAEHVNSSIGTLENWTNVITFLNNWTNYDTGIHEPAGFYKDTNERVFLRGAVKDGTADPIFELPAGYRPTKEERFAVSNDGAFSEVKIEPNGLVSRSTGGNIRLHLTGISFRI